MKQGFTLVEMLIVMVIIIMLAMAMIGTLNPIALVGKANDATRKKDLARIKVAFEEYFNDRGCYPSDNDMVFPNLLSSLKDKRNCGTGVFSQWGITSWPCDPVTKQPYYIFVDTANNGCPSWYKILTNLDNKTDLQTPAGWYSQTSSMVYGFGDGTVHAKDVNYGTSSSNKSWYEMVMNPECISTQGQCYRLTNGIFSGMGMGTFYNAYTNTNVNCLVPCCNDGAVCQ